MSGHNSCSIEDITWCFSIAIDGNRKHVQCKFCTKVIRGGITRLKQHNYWSTEDIGWCFGIAINGNRKHVQCKICSKVIRGGITRLKQHLAHKTGDNIKRKRDKTRITRDFQDEITRSFNRNDYVDQEEDEDAWLAHSVYTNPLFETIHEVDLDVRAPSSYVLSHVYLPEAAKEIKKWILKFAPKWKKGVSP
ncbi:hypothetical protein Cgig2_016548 [Carnegiea gigantea]|uniref:BED-type domain-containing protein n=1 Tax=Carnegiea gigantea TaxID=171969 RepID=A0A9Q1GI74_9CARY|nr:hypothetical protein Cgig2_016548 [Carnegiea gigantea]